MLENIFTNNKNFELDLTQKQRKILIKRNKSTSSKHEDNKQFMFIVPWMQYEDENSSQTVKKNLIRSD